MHNYDDHDDYDDYDDYDNYDEDFADPGGNSALRRETEDNPRIYPCPTCEEPDMLTFQDKQLGYQCDYCANKAEGFGPQY